MEAGLGQLQLSPAAFWAMTPKEFSAAMRGRFGDGTQSLPPGRSALAELMAEFPDGAWTSVRGLKAKAQEPENKERWNG